MDNQHRKIKGYRELSEEEVALMNSVKELGELYAAKLEELSSLRDNEPGTTCAQHIQTVEAYRCIREAKSYLQTGQMWLVRAIALPESF